MVQIDLIERDLAAKMVATAERFEREEWEATQRAALLPGLPFCAKCKRRVDRLTRTRDLETGDHVWTVECHGDQQRVRLSSLQLVDAAGVRCGVAFAERDLLEA